jgi:hypothetical protein
VQKIELQVLLRQILKDKQDKIGVQEMLIELANHRLKLAEKGKKLKTKGVKQKTRD